MRDLPFFFLSIYTIVYTFLLWCEFSGSRLLLDQPKNCIKSCILLALFFPKCWRYPLNSKCRDCLFVD
ncbi:hypothetical protein COO08_29725 [Bacillus toyonensis]|nr:hypothetical protein COO08_29725 [Bacillus toyonensis]PEF96852.1 hypothetical protein COO01_21580 [Bacillus toyonensis]PHD83863.1 hypothetical protein COF55_28105 [Bacillus toyonensis]